MREEKVEILIRRKGLEKMAQWFKSCTSRAEDPNSVPSTHIKPLK